MVVAPIRSGVIGRGHYGAGKAVFDTLKLTTRLRRPWKRFMVTERFVECTRLRQSNARVCNIRCRPHMR